MTDLNGAAKNYDNVKRQIENWKAEIVSQTIKIKSALAQKEFGRALHHATGYLEATIQQLSKLWFYTWLPKWMLVGYLIWAI